MALRTHTFSVTDIQIIQAFKSLHPRIVHPDSPTDDDLILIRQGLGLGDADMLNLNWLRNQVVKLRKNKHLKE